MSSGPGQMAYAIGVAVAKDGSVFAADFGNNRITKWAPSTFLRLEKTPGGL